MTNAPSIDTYSKPTDWDTPFRYVPPCPIGEFSRIGANPVVADLSQNGSTETRRTNDGVAVENEQAQREAA
jgi:hypothetical protein